MVGKLTCAFENMHIPLDDKNDRSPCSWSVSVPGICSVFAHIKPQYSTRVLKNAALPSPWKKDTQPAGCRKSGHHCGPDCICLSCSNVREHRASENDVNLEIAEGVGPESDSDADLEEEVEEIMYEVFGGYECSDDHYRRDSETENENDMDLDLEDS